MYRALVTLFGKALLWMLRRSGHSGSALPGLIVEKLAPNYLAKAASQFTQGIILVTGTNGKTSTTKLISGILEDRGKTVLVNRTGSNMSRGIIAALIEQANWRGKINFQYGLFEVDEAFVADVAKKTRPSILVVLNLLRDQLDRYGELNRTAKLIAGAVPYVKKLILNGDDALVKSLVDAADEQEISMFGAIASLQRALPDDASLLKKAGKKAVKVSSDSRPIAMLLTLSQPNKTGQKISLKHNDISYHTSLQLPGLYNAYNAAAALLCVVSLGIGTKDALEALPKVTPAFGRSERIHIGKTDLELLLVKNPSGFNQIISTFLVDDKNASILIAINDNIADGRDVSWLWDVDFELMRSAQNSTILVSGLRAYDLAVRLKYAGIKCVVEPELSRALKLFKSELRSSQIGYIVPTYTAMLQLRSQLAKKEDIKKIWR